MKYSKYFESWWEERSKKILKVKRVSAKHWAWIGWEGRKVDSKARKEKADRLFQEQLAKDVAAGIDIHSPTYWGDCS